MLSCEYYYLGSKLSIDRFLTFYPGFHINNMHVVLSAQAFVITSKSYLCLFRGLAYAACSGILWHVQLAAGDLQVHVEQ